MTKYADLHGTFCRPKTVCATAAHFVARRQIVHGGDEMCRQRRYNLSPATNCAGATKCAVTGSNIANLYKDTGWVPLHDRRDMHSLCLLYKLFRGEGPSYLRDRLPPEVGERTDYRYPLRNMNDADIPFTRLDIFKRSFFPHALSLWNKLDLETRKSHSLYAFKEGITPKPDKFKYFCYSGDRWAGDSSC